MIKRILFIFGTRPEAIKMIPLYHEFSKHKNKYECLICVTGQHRNMLDNVLQLFGVIPDYDLDIMKVNQNLFDTTIAILAKLESILEDIKPDAVFVHGDTTTCMVSALSCFYKKLPIFHVESGLRTYNNQNPYPEEANRQIVKSLATLHFAPTEHNRDNLLREGVEFSKIFVTGNTVIDALKFIHNKNTTNIELYSYLKKKLSFNYRGEKYILITAHRRENFGQNITDILNALIKISEENKSVYIIFPVHLNPNIRNQVYKHIDEKFHSRIILTDPLNYSEFVELIYYSHTILTDSGGIQEEAPTFGKPVVLLRSNTERPEGILSGTVKLVGSRTSDILLEVNKLLQDRNYYNSISNTANPYGDGNASQVIFNFVNQYFYDSFNKK